MGSYVIETLPESRVDLKSDVDKAEIITKSGIREQQRFEEITSVFSTAFSFAT